MQLGLSHLSQFSQHPLGEAMDLGVIRFTRGLQLPNWDAIHVLDVLDVDGTHRAHCCYHRLAHCCLQFERMNDVGCVSYFARVVDFVGG